MDNQQQSNYRYIVQNPDKEWSRFATWYKKLVKHGVVWYWELRRDPTNKYGWSYTGRAKLQYGGKTQFLSAKQLQDWIQRVLAKLDVKSEKAAGM